MLIDLVLTLVFFHELTQTLTRIGIVWKEITSLQTLLNLLFYLLYCFALFILPIFIYAWSKTTFQLFFFPPSQQMVTISLMIPASSISLPEVNNVKVSFHVNGKEITTSCEILDRFSYPECYLLENSQYLLFPMNSPLSLSLATRAFTFSLRYTDPEDKKPRQIPKRLIIYVKNPLLLEKVTESPTD